MLPRNPFQDMSLEAEGFMCKVLPDGTLQMTGVLQMRAPSEVLGPFLRQIHQKLMAVRQRELKVDVTHLTHVNSTSIFLFIEWARWIANAPVSDRYSLHFLTRAGVAWQQLMLPTMQRICVGHIRVSVV